MMAQISQFALLGWVPGYLEIAIFAAVLMLLFGSQKLPLLMRNMGRSVNEFKAGIKEKPVETPRVEEEEDVEKVEEAATEEVS